VLERPPPWPLCEPLSDGHGRAAVPILVGGQRQHILVGPRPRGCTLRHRVALGVLQLAHPVHVENVLHLPCCLRVALHQPNHVHQLVLAWALAHLHAKAWCWLLTSVLASTQIWREMSVTDDRISHHAQQRSGGVNSVANLSHGSADVGSCVVAEQQSEFGSETQSRQFGLSRWWRRWSGAADLA
jgi:hypothetical protein